VYFYKTRDKYYEQRRRLNNILEEDLNRQEFNRSKIFKKKFNALTVSKVSFLIQFFHKYKLK